MFVEKIFFGKYMFLDNIIVGNILNLRNSSVSKYIKIHDMLANSLVLANF